MLCVSLLLSLSSLLHWRLASTISTYSQRVCGLYPNLFPGGSFLNTMDFVGSSNDSNSFYKYRTLSCILCLDFSCPSLILTPDLISLFPAPVCVCQDRIQEGSFPVFFQMWSYHNLVFFYILSLCCILCFHQETLWKR